MKSSMSRFATIAAALVSIAVPAAAFAQAGASASAPQWMPVPPILPLGARLAVVSGNPFEPGRFTVAFAMPDGYTLPPHTNPASEFAVVKSGALAVGLGRKMDKKKSAILSAGDTATTAAGVPHWSIARGETRLEVTYETGPYGIAYMNVRDEPIGHAFPNGY